MSRDKDGDERPIWINADAMNANKATLTALGTVMDLMTFYWWPTMAPFTFDPEEIAARLNEAMPARGYTPEQLLADRSDIASFFVETSDGRWAPSPEYFSLTNGNPGAERT